MKKHCTRRMLTLLSGSILVTLMSFQPVNPAAASSPSKMIPSLRSFMTMIRFPTR